VRAAVIGATGFVGRALARVARLRGRRRPIVPVPLLSPRLSSYWLHLVIPVHASVARPWRPSRL
jgi:uncharacterized protein YbjT (DUF2867 family)